MSQHSARTLPNPDVRYARDPAPGRAFGAFPEQRAVRFRVLAPAARDLRVRVLTGTAAGSYQLQAAADGVWEGVVPDARAGDRYQCSIDGSRPLPDPASRFQPEGVHGPSEVIDPDSYQWRSRGWSGRPARELTIYEVHVGTFTRDGTFSAAAARLPALAELGITAIELMPVADFAGQRNWGYDGVCPYAPSRNYGRPEDLRAFVDAAHALGIAVILDVVYNHLGPEGAYLTQFHPGYVTDRHSTPWGGAVNLDGPGSDHVRRFIVDNAAHWVREYRLDGLRLDATHSLIDESPTHIVAALAAAVEAAAAWPVVVYAEDHRNLASLMVRRESGGWGLDGVWADDFHHVVRRQLAGDAHGYYRDYEGSLDELARTLRQGWLYTGQHSAHGGGRRGTDASTVPMHKFVVCLQNHDQVGNRATGDRLHHTIAAAAWRAASTLLLTAPMTPLLFMGQEWAASSPFQFFTDLEPRLGQAVTEGRRREFKDFPEFGDAAARERIPDPQAATTFERSKLDWQERGQPPHRESLALYTELLHLRNAHPALGGSSELTADVAAIDGAIVLRRGQGGEQFVCVVRLQGAGVTTLAGPFDSVPVVVLTTEDPRFAEDPRPPRVETSAGAVRVAFLRPGAVILRW